ncbi:MAG: hypothetical protein ACREOM_12865, partial [Candidatus Dormibacteraceae bacterium]
MYSLRGLLSTFTGRHCVHAVFALAAISNQLSFTALAASPSGTTTASRHGRAAAITCVTAQPDNCEAPAPVDSGPQLSLPTGATQCPESGPYAACPTTGHPPQAGVASLPDGQTACPVPAGAPLLGSLAACTDAVIHVQLLGGRGAAAAPLVAPSVPASSLAPGVAQRLQLTAIPATVRPGQNSLLTATATSSVTGTGKVIEIFDQTSGTLAAACVRASQCLIDYRAQAGVHTFSAFITPPSQSMPDANQAVASNAVTVGWLDSSVSASDLVVGAGEPVTLTASSTLDVASSGRWLEIYDLTAKSKLTYCSRGSRCTVTVKQPQAGIHEIVGYVTGQPEAVSSPIQVTWLGVSLSASTTSQKSAGWVHLTATANANLSSTPWVMAIYDDQGRLVDHACKNGTICSVQAWLTGGTVPTYTAAIGLLPAQARPDALDAILQKIGGTKLVHLQAHSPAVQPTHMLWGVDSCKAFTSDAKGASGLYPQVVGAYGTPDFWGRYLTDTVCPGISATEIAAAAHNHMGILPIYNDYDCSAVSGNAAGSAYAIAAVQWLRNDLIPQGTVIAVDIEPAGPQCPGAGNVDVGF